MNLFSILTIFISFAHQVTIVESSILGSQFKFDEFYKQIALRTGIGARLGFSYFIIRLDAAIPVRKPVISNQKFQWVVGDIDFYNKTWRQENLVFNLAIGYPF